MIKGKKKPSEESVGRYKQSHEKNSCRGRDRTSTRQLAVVQSSVVDPGRIDIATNTALCYVYPVILTPETRGHVCQKFHHPTVLSRT